ncbi:MAG: SUMF1/EgtB/PvdO family nonheme iron enzyme [Polyangiaceae bacterium]|nr:SUMF1/EgtB/PvdO family nonheme iron enzyme [Polyangiaceae bacterium]
MLAGEVATLIRYSWAPLALACAVACGKDERAIHYPPVPPGLAGETVTVSGPVTIGFTTGHLRAEAHVDTVRISKYPVTVAQFEQCVKAGVCQAVSQLGCGTTDASPSKQAMALCVGQENAEQYCAWQGARLPRLREWLLASRGSKPARFPWGQSAPTCAQHPYAELVVEGNAVPTGRRQLLKQECESRAVGLLETAKHRDGRAIGGMEDVLLAPRELVGPDPASPYPPCSGEAPSCVIYGLDAAAIDFAGPPREVKDEAYSMRCAWGGK